MLHVFRGFEKGFRYSAPFITMEKTSLNHRFVNLIKSYYANMTAVVRWNNSFTESIKVRSGYSSAYLIRVIAILLIIGGVELNPGPPTKKQTTLSTVRTPETKEVMEDDLKSIVIQIHTELRTLGARLESRLHNIEQKFDEWDQRLTVIETSQKTCLELATKNDLRIKTLEDHGDMLDRKTRENNLIFYGIIGPEAETQMKPYANWLRR
ncbi:hypothetical protein LAZ67_1007327 [Cordylochernes scorpioides]|uniref:Uncharacterized protein n=1 Tax=Cordylochernes scorpioides TaxID=51811 RepID=A0ABY6JZG6_9ARAC|nr:hypothetical protein LAZ67_1007327 [Cordylochernes scorpioides]